MVAPTVTLEIVGLSSSHKVGDYVFTLATMFISGSDSYELSQGSATIRLDELAMTIATTNAEVGADTKITFKILML